MPFLPEGSSSWLACPKSRRPRRRIEATDRQIDALVYELVYELYGLTEEEIAILEGEKGS